MPVIRRERGVSASVHGDDGTAKKYEIKAQMIGAAADPNQRLQILNRICTVEFPRALGLSGHAKEVVRALGLEGASPAPAQPPQAEDNQGSTDPVLGPEETTMFRAVAARLKYLSQDWSDITFATVKLHSKRSRPNGQDLKNMKSVSSFIIGRVVQTPCLHLLTQTGQETDSQGSRSVEA